MRRVRTRHGPGPDGAYGTPGPRRTPPPPPPPDAPTSQSPRDALTARHTRFFVLGGIALTAWGTITSLSPGAGEAADAGSPYRTIPLGILTLAAGIGPNASARARRRRNAAAPGARRGGDRARGPEDTAPPAP
ncbi:hypothetical protein HNR25_005086 [Streptomonospora salina]|uniref:Uncharacterized protein n=1 Tax=Streptomonospora salina TaxID=104205 RepID=A0A841EB28_9ACTN|nr:hypothetical protein [Streptomonospora salina]